MHMATVSVFKLEHLVLLGVDDPDFFAGCVGVRMDVPDLSDPFNWTGLPYHIKQKIVSDFWATQEDQFVLDWVTEAPVDGIRFGGILSPSAYDFPDYPVSSHRQEMFKQYNTLNHRLISSLGLPEHLMTPTLNPSVCNTDVRYNGVVLSQLEIPVELEKTRQLVIEFIKEVAADDYPNLLTLFVARGGNICDLTEFFALVSDAAEKEQILEESCVRDQVGIRDLQRLQQLADTTMHLDPSIRREPPVRSREDERGHERYLRDSVRGIFMDQGSIDVGKLLIPIDPGSESNFDRPGSDRDYTKLAIKATPEQLEECAEGSGLVKVFENGEYVPRVRGYVVGADGVERDLRDINFMDLLLGPVEGDYIVGEAVPVANLHAQHFADVFAQNCQEGNMVQVISDTPGDSSDLWSPIDILMSQKAIDRRMVRKEEHLFPFAGHTYKQTVFLSPEDVTGLCELYIPTVDDKCPQEPTVKIQNATLSGAFNEHLSGSRSPWGNVPVVDHTSEGFLTLVDGRGNPVSREEQQAYEVAILEEQEAEAQLRRPNPVREQWEKHGDSFEGRIPHIAQFVELTKLTSQQGRNETMAFFLSPTPIGEPEVLTPEEIADREQAIQEASAGKLDYLLEGTQWDPKNRK